MMSKIKILHTSDWHLGRRLFEHDRLDEMKKFLEWLLKILEDEKINLMLVAGDIFNTTTPSVQAQELYYNFLDDFRNSSCRDLVIIAGNHDSPAFIDLPEKLLKSFHIHVIGSAQNPDKEIIIIRDEKNNPVAIVCAVPFLHDHDVIKELHGYDFKSHQEALISGIYEYYRKKFVKAHSIQRFYNNIPVIAMGHLFMTGGHVIEGDGVRDLYLGSLVQIKADLFPEYISYTALGHLHSQQTAGRFNICYSGSPIAMNFGESEKIRKSVNIIEISENNEAHVKNIPVPVSRKLLKIQGDVDTVINELKNLKPEISTWIEIILNQRVPKPETEIFYDCIASKTSAEILGIKFENNDEQDSVNDIPENALLSDFSPVGMFEMCLDKNNIEHEKKNLYLKMYQDILNDIKQENY